MGKGDIKTKKGKRINKSYGVHRLRANNKPNTEKTAPAKKVSTKK